MDLQQAKEFLKDSDRYELRDRAFGDTEVTWEINGDEVASGYFSTRQAEVWIVSESHIAFEADEARQLRDCGHLAQVSRNDTTGPDL